MNSPSLPLFEETQRFQKAWVKIPLAGYGILVLSLAAWAAYQQFVLGVPFSDHGRPMSDGETALFSVFLGLVGAGLPLWVLALRLTVRVDHERVLVHFVTLRKRSIPLTDIASWEPLTYRPVWDYGGWGIRYSLKHRRWAYNVSGNRGVLLRFTNGKSLLIGSQRPEELAAALETAKKSLGPNGEA